MVTLKVRMVEDGFRPPTMQPHTERVVKLPSTQARSNVAARWSGEIGRHASDMSERRAIRRCFTIPGVQTIQLIFHRVVSMALFWTPRISDAIIGNLLSDTCKPYDKTPQTLYHSGAEVPSSPKQSIHPVGSDAMRW